MVTESPITKVTGRDRYRSGLYTRMNPDMGSRDASYKAAEIARILTRNAITPASICDVGCGSGAVVADLARLVPAATNLDGYDISADLAPAWERHVDPRLQFHVGEAPSGDRHYDLLMLIDVIEHLEDPFAVLRGLVDRADAFVLHIPLDLSVLSLLRGSLSQVREQVGHLHWFTKPLAEAMLRDAGFRILDSHFTASSLVVRPQNMRVWLARYPRKLLMRVNADIAAVTLGGTSLMVLAVPAHGPVTGGPGGD